jgi:hypothetical protein
MDLSTVLDLLTLVVVAVGLLLWRAFGAGVEQAMKDQATELVRQRNRAAELARELEKTRGTERQELRFASYGQLWTAMRPLAIYDETPVDRSTMETLSKKLSDWYFSAAGGLMLTSHNRELYFALQDLVSAVAANPDWTAERMRDPKEIFEGVLNERGLTAARALLGHVDAVAPESWPGTELETLASAWRKDVVKLADDWTALDARERFAVLQQVSSVLRTGLTKDVESRLR